MTALRLVRPPDLAPRTPRLALPAGATACHCHTFGPPDRFPLIPNRLFDVGNHPIEQLVALHDRLGLQRAVIVQSVLHGPSYAYMADANARYPGRFKYIAMPTAETSDADLAGMEACGAVGIRVAYRGSPHVDEKLLAKLVERGWHVQFWYRGAEEATNWLPIIRRTPGEHVIDHLGWPDPAEGLDGTAFRITLDLVTSGRAYVKLSGPGRYSKAGKLPYRDVLPFIRKLAAEAPERLLWGSDWPHADLPGEMPNDGDLVDLIGEWLPHEKLRKLVLVENPARKFGFPA